MSNDLIELKRVARCILMGFVIISIMGASVRADLLSTTVRDELSQDPRAISSSISNDLRLTKIFFYIEHEGQQYKATMVEDLSVPPPSQTDLESLFEYIYSRSNWYIVNMQGDLVQDPDHYADLAWLAEIAYLGVTIWQPENLRGQATQGRVILLVSAIADFLQWIGEAAAKLLAGVITGGSSAVVETGEIALESVLKEFAKQIFAQIQAGILEDSVTFTKNISRSLILDSTLRLEQAAASIEPIYNQFRRDYPDQEVYVDSATLQQFHKDVKIGYSNSYGGMMGLTTLYDEGWEGLRNYLWNVATAPIPFSSEEELFLYLCDTLGESVPAAVEFFESAKLKEQEFELREDVLRRRAQAFQQRFISEGPPGEGGSPPAQVILSSPSISPSTVGDTNTQFHFSVVYTHSGNQSPDYVRMMINGTPVNMSQGNPSDTNYVDGVEFVCSSAFDAGHYYYYFETSDGNNTIQLGFPMNFHFQVDFPAPAQISVTAHPASVPMDGSSTSEIRVEVKDALGNPLPGQAVEFTADRDFTFSPGSTMTDPNGVAFTLFQPHELGDITVTAMVGRLTGHVTVNAYPVSGVYDIQLSAQAFESTDTYKKYEINPYVTYSSSGETVYGKAIIFTTNRGTFQTGSQTISALLNDGELDFGNPDCPCPIILTLTSPGPVTIMATVESSTSSMTFNVTLGVPTEFDPGKNVTGDGGTEQYETDHEVSWSPDGNFLATMSGSSIYIWRVSNWSLYKSFSEPWGYPIRAIEFSPQGTYVAAAAAYNLDIFALSDGCTWHIYDDNGMEKNHSISWSDDESRVALVNTDTTIRIYNANSQNLERTLSVPPTGSTGNEELFCVDWHGNRLAAGGAGGIVYTWDTNTWSSWDCDLEFWEINSLKWAPDGSFLAVAGSRDVDLGNDLAFLYPDGTVFRKVDLDTQWSTSIDWAPDSSRVVASKEPGFPAKIVDTSGSLEAKLRSAGDLSVGWSSHDLIAVAGGSVNIYAPYDGSPPTVLVTSPANNSFTTNSTVAISGTISDESGIASASMAVNGGNAIPITILDDGTFSVVVELADGHNEISVSATDISGQSSTTTVSVLVEELHDQTGPLISQPQVSDSEAEMGTILTISARVTDEWSGVNPGSVVAYVQFPDELDVASVQLYDDGATSGDMVAGDNIFTGQWNSSSMIDGVYMVDFVASDNEGNSREVENSLSIVLYDLPDISAVSASPIAPTTSDSVSVSARIADSSGIAVATLYYSLNSGSTWIPLNMTYDLEQSKYVATIPPQMPGSVEYKVEATNSSSYSSTSDVSSYYVELGPAVFRFKAYLPVIMKNSQP